MPLSKIVIDKDLKMGRYSIKGQYRPEEWETEELDWGDLVVETKVLSVKTRVAPQTTNTIWTNPSDYARQIRVTSSGPDTGANPFEPVILIDGEIVYTGYSTTFEAGPFWVPAGKQIHLKTRVGGANDVQVDYYDTGVIAGPKTFDLTGKWLALGLDMHGLDATVKIQGVEVPYSDYAKYFPLVPTEITIPGGWDTSQGVPPVTVKVYK